MFHHRLLGIRLLFLATCSAKVSNKLVYCLIFPGIYLADMVSKSAKYFVGPAPVFLMMLQLLCDESTKPNCCPAALRGRSGRPI